MIPCERDRCRGLAQLPQRAIDMNWILANRCIVRDRDTGNSFLITGNGGLPPRPGDPPLPSFPTGDVQGIETATTPAAAPIREAEGKSERRPRLGFLAFFLSSAF